MARFREPNIPDIDEEIQELNNRIALLESTREMHEQVQRFLNETYQGQYSIGTIKMLYNAIMAYHVWAKENVLSRP